MNEATSGLAELARTAVHAARFGSLSTYPRLAPHRPHTTTVHVAGQDDGSLLAYLLPRAPGALMLLQRPLATVRVAPAGLHAVTVHGRARRRPDADTEQLYAFQVSVGAVRIGDATNLPVDTARYAQAQPDHVRAQAPALLEHLNLGHRPELAACLRSHGVDAETAEATALDRHGLTAVGVGPSGVSQVSLSFPAPVTRLEELGAGLCAVLHCQCQPGR
jgi:hypothetical protein